MKGFSDVLFRSVDGLSLYARDYNAVESNAAVVCLHGLTRNSADFSHLGERLGDRYRVIAVDQRGRGRSQYDDDPARYQLPVYVQDTVTLLDTLALESVILIGTSMGGLMSMMLSAMYPHRVRGVILNDIGPQVDPRGLQRIQSGLGKSSPVSNWKEAVAYVKKVNGRELPRLNEQQWLAFARNVYRENATGQLQLAYDSAIADVLIEGKSDAVAPDLWPLFDAMAVIPTLLIRAENSDILSERCVEKMRQRKPDLDFIEVSQCGHAPLLNEAECLEAIERFLDSLVRNPL